MAHYNESNFFLCFIRNNVNGCKWSFENEMLKMEVFGQLAA